MPAWHVAELFLGVVLTEQLHAHDGEDEDDDEQDEAEVTEGAHCSTDDPDEEIQSGPGLGQFEDTQLCVFCESQLGLNMY